MITSRTNTIVGTLGREPVHPFPARMAPGIALEIMSAPKRPLRVLDPMMGSGTVLAVARSKGHQAIGIDIDPLAVLISKVWTTAVDPDRVRDKASEVLGRAKHIFSTLRTRDAYPREADRETRRFVAYWFDDYARRQLASLATSIGRVRDGSTRDLLWCGFSRLIITKQAGASLAMDLSHSRPHKSFDHAPVKPFRKFLRAVERVVENCIDKESVGRGSRTHVREGDARHLPINDASIDLVLTSPPYLNAIDYMRCSKFSLVWMGHSIAELRRLRSDSVGAELGDGTALDDEEITGIISDLKLQPALSTRDKSMLARYVSDMRRTVREVARVLAPGGKAVYVVGENTIRGTYIRNSAIVCAVAQLAQLALRERRVRLLPPDRRYLPPPVGGKKSAALNSRIRREVILTFTKSSTRKDSQAA